MTDLGELVFGETFGQVNRRRRRGRVRVRRAGSDDQPRDESGKWTSGGGGSSGKGSEQNARVVSETARLLPPDWKVKETGEGAFVTAPSGATFHVLADANLPMRVGQIAKSEGVELRGEQKLYDAGTGSSWMVTVIGPEEPNGEVPVFSDGPTYVSAEDLHDVSEAPAPAPAARDAEPARPFGNDERSNVREFEGPIYDGHPDFAAAVNQFSSNSPNTLEAVELRAALVDMGSADRDSEWVDLDEMAEYGDDLGVDREDYEGGIPESVRPSDDLMQAAAAIHARYEDPDPALDQPVTLYRGAMNAGPSGAVDFDVNVLSSWSTSREIAQKFGTVVRADVPLRQLVGEGAIGEDEILVYSPDQVIEGTIE